MRVACLFEKHKSLLAETETLAAAELSDRTPTDEAANAAAFDGLHGLERQIIDTRCTQLASISAKLALALGYARQNAADGLLEHEWEMVQSARADLLAMIASPVAGGTLIGADELAGLVG